MLAAITTYNSSLRFSAKASQPNNQKQLPLGAPAAPLTHQMKKRNGEPVMKPLPTASTFSYQRPVVTLKEPKDQQFVLRHWAKRLHLLGLPETQLAAVPGVVKRSKPAAQGGGDEYYYPRTPDRFSLVYGQLDQTSAPEQFFSGPDRIEFSVFKTPHYIQTPSIILYEQDLPLGMKERVALGAVVHRCELKPKGAKKDDSPIRTWFSNPLSYFMMSNMSTTMGSETYLVLPVRSDKDTRKGLQRLRASRIKHAQGDHDGALCYWGDRMKLDNRELTGEVGVSKLRRITPDNCLVMPTTQVVTPEETILAGPLIQQFVSGLNRFMTGAFQQRRPIVGLEETPVPSAIEIAAFAKK